MDLTGNTLKFNRWKTFFVQMGPLEHFGKENIIFQNARYVGVDIPMFGNVENSSQNEHILTHEQVLDP
jgi:hypothetical protein